VARREAAKTILADPRRVVAEIGGKRPAVAESVADLRGEGGVRSAVEEDDLGVLGAAREHLGEASIAEPRDPLVEDRPVVELRHHGVADRSGRAHEEPSVLVAAGTPPRASLIASITCAAV